MQCGDSPCMTLLLISASHHTSLTLSTGAGRRRISLLSLFPTGVKPHTDSTPTIKCTHTSSRALEDVWWQMIRQHLTTGVLSLTFHPWPWAESFSHRGQPSISSHQSHMYATSFHFPQPLPAPNIHHYSLPFYWHVGKHKHFTTSLSLCLSCTETHTRTHSDGSFKTWYVLCCEVICRCTRGAAPWWHICTYISACTETWHGWNPWTYWQLRPFG